MPERDIRLVARKTNRPQCCSISQRILFVLSPQLHPHPLISSTLWCAWNPSQGPCPLQTILLKTTGQGRDHAAIIHITTSAQMYPVANSLTKQLWQLIHGPQHPSGLHRGPSVRHSRDLTLSVKLHYWSFPSIVFLVWYGEISLNRLKDYNGLILRLQERDGYWILNPPFV